MICKKCDKEIQKISSNARNSINRAKGEMDKALSKMSKTLIDLVNEKARSGEISHEDKSYIRSSIKKEIEVIFQSINAQLLHLERDFFKGTFSNIV